MKNNNIGPRIRINTRQNMKRNSHLHKIFFLKKTSAFYMQAHVYVGYNSNDIICVESGGREVEGTGNQELQLITEGI